MGKFLFIIVKMWCVLQTAAQHMAYRHATDANFRHSRFQIIKLGLIGHDFNMIKATLGLRVSAEEEIAGLDVTEHGLPPYTNDFKAMFETAYHTSLSPAAIPATMEEAVPVQEMPSVL